MEKLIFEKSTAGRKGYNLPKPFASEYKAEDTIDSQLLRSSDTLLPEVSEIEVARHFQHLSHLNFNIEKGMYPLGSCTMKYNPKVNEQTASLPGFAGLHPMAEEEDAQGAMKLMYDLNNCLKEITGLPGCSMQPAAGSQGELTGILMFRAYHLDRGDTKRTKILIPDSAHGTNPASAAIAGFKVVSIKSGKDGCIDLEDLKSKCNDEVAGLMLTNPNTLGLFEQDIVEIQEAVDGCGGLMYMDGANMNALLGIARPGDMKFDCVHINLHKTFSTPHGGGGPGAGPVCVSERLRPYLPGPLVEMEGDKYVYVTPEKTIGKVHSFFGNFGVFVRALTYMRMLGPEGLFSVSKNAIINANYVLSRLKGHFEVPFDNFCLHECIISGNWQKDIGVSTRDIAKRLLDYGYHAPTIYFPLVVREAMLIEPTETENKENLDGFCDAMIAIAKEAKEEPDTVTGAPYTAPLKRLDEAGANRNVNIKWTPSNN
ncbi:MAG: aminomethyl-transferring glycine dehydrogenase subunit GcvPB [Candidatus Kapaibacteriales bacterium]